MSRRECRGERCEEEWRNMRRFLGVAGVAVMMVLGTGVPAGAEMIVDKGGVFVIPDELTQVPDPGMLDANCSLGTYVMVEGILDYKSKYSDDDSRLFLEADWIDSTWILQETGERYGLTDRSGADFKYVADKTGTPRMAQGYWVMEWYNLSTGEISDYIRTDFDALVSESTC
jgi:hypothetical protein